MMKQAPANFQLDHQRQPFCTRRKYYRVEARCAQDATLLCPQIRLGVIQTDFQPGHHVIGDFTARWSGP
jgi:hypothetical protein